MTTDKRATVKVEESEYRILKRLAKERRQTIKTVLGLAITEFEARHGSKQKDAE